MRELFEQHQNRILHVAQRGFLVCVSCLDALIGVSQLLYPDCPVANDSTIR